MTISKNDPRLTHYALDELDTAELAEIEAAVQASPELQAEVATIRETIAQISETFAEEPLPEKEPADAPAPASLEKAKTKKFNGLRTLALIATSVLIIALGVFAFNPDMRKMFVADNTDARKSSPNDYDRSYSNTSAPMDDYADMDDGLRDTVQHEKAARAHGLASLETARFRVLIPARTSATTLRL